MYEHSGLIAELTALALSIRDETDCRLEGYLAAVERAKAAAASETRPTLRVIVPVTEALMWADALQQTTRQPASREDAPAALASDPSMRALGFVRSGVRDYWACVSFFERSAREWVWPRAERLPLPAEHESADPLGKRAYKEVLEGRSVVATLDELATRLTGRGSAKRVPSPPSGRS